MKKSLSAAGLAAIALLVAAPMTFAQSTTQAPAAQPAAPAAQPAQVQPAQPSATPATPASPASPSVAPSPTQPNPVSPTSPPDQVDPAAQSTPAALQGCRTRKEVGEACACLSDTSRIGTSTANPDGGRNICVRPD
ncbi:MAG: hypothetical protein JNJ73_07235 [Hyphomonadaceae bacterium]|nr:hypothetical protein [Hyphomonadaceae bacterium]